MPKTKKKKTARKRKVIKKVKRVSRKKVTKRKAAPKKKRSRKRHVVRQVQRTSVVRVVTGKRKPRKRKRAKRRRSVVMAGRSRSRSVGKKSGSGLLIGLGIGALAIYLLSKKSTTTAYPNYPALPPLTQTSNYQRNDQTNSIVNYALAAGLAVDAITKLINTLNNSDDSQVKQIYDNVETTGDIGVYV